MALWSGRWWAQTVWPQRRVTGAVRMWGGEEAGQRRRGTSLACMGGGGGGGGGGGEGVRGGGGGGGGGGEGTHAAGFWDFDDGHAVAVRALHLDVEFFVPDDEDGVYCGVCGERARLYARIARGAWDECARVSRAEGGTHFERHRRRL